MEDSVLTSHIEISPEETPSPGNRAGTAPTLHRETLVALTARAYGVAIAAAQSAADLILGAKSALERTIACERELDELDREIDERVATEIADASIAQVREKLACLKCMIDLERVVDL